MEAVIGNEGEKDEEIIANVITFSQLKSLHLDRLPRLISFYPRIKKATTTESHSFPPPQSLFNEKVAFPTLEVLSFNEMPNITEIWDNLLPAESFCLLRSLQVWNCEKLMNVVPSHMISQLKSIETLEVFQCPKMEVIVVLEKKEEETQEATTNKDMIIVQFPQLRILRLFNLRRLSSFNNTSIIIKTRSLFNHQVAFPTLEKLVIYGMPNIIEIWDKNLLPAKSFCLLKSLEVGNCEKLMNVVPSNMLPQLKSIETLEVSYGPEMEVIVVLEKREEETQEATTNKDMIIMQVEFPTLEELFIWGMPNITEIWDNNLLPAESFCLLRSLKVQYCEKLMNVVPSHMLPQLKSIETLEVFECPEMEVIVILEKREEETQEATTNKNMIIVFPQLWKMELRELENLKGVCAYKSEDQLNFNVQFPQLQKLRLENLERLSSFNNTCAITETRPLFNHQVEFPTLEELFICGMPNITEIWDKNLLPAESFCLLRSLKVKNCEKLMNVVPSHMLPQLKSIKTLVVSWCPEMEVIVIFLEKREEETHEATTNKDMIIVFPQLRKMKLRVLENLKGVCAYKFEDQLNFNVQVAFPSLEELSIYEIPNITELWDKNLLRPESFCLLRSLGVRGYEKLKSLTVQGCKKLMNVVPSHMIPLLKNMETLYVSKCPEMKVIIVLEKREEETQETTNKDIIVFLKLTSLKLRELENLKGVCAYKSEDQLCFNVQVAFPALEELYIGSMPNITELWEKNLRQPESFCLPRSLRVRSCEKLRSLKVEDCEKLMNAVSSHMFPLLKNIQILEVSNCPQMEVIVVMEKREEETQEATNKDIIVFPELTSLTLRELENLKGVCAYKSEDRLCFNVQVAFPSLEKLSIYEMPNITEIWDKNLLQPESFCLPRSLRIRGCVKLRSLKVKDCEKLMNVVPSHMFPLLKSIETLEVSDCPEMEVIVVIEKREEETQEATNKDMIIVFPQLREMTLQGLENLKGVCAYKSEDRLCFNVQVAFPSLEKLSIYEMPNITEIWDNNLLQPESFCLLRSLGVRSYEKLKSLRVQGCKKLMYVIPSHMFPLLKNIETLDVSECPEMEVIVVLEKREEETQETTNKDIIVFPKLWSLWLKKLENLKGVCAYKSEDRLCFNVQVVFPKLWGCRNLDEHSEKIFTEATSNKKECATMDASGSGMLLQL